MNRRALLTALGTASAVSFAGCSRIRGESIPAGTLRFENHHELPHIISVAVSAVGAEPVTTGEGYDVRGDVTIPKTQRNLRASASVAPGETQTFEAVFTEPVVYLVEFTIDGTAPENGGRVPLSPVPDDRDYYNYVQGIVDEAGDFSWVSTTTNASGPFDS